jgi:predicted nuclease of predicted toxin-antitoxin system
MKIKIDEDLPKAVAELVRQLFPDTASVLEEGISGILDPELWEIAQEEGRFLITGDKGFANIRKYPPGTHYGVLLLRPDGEGIPPKGLS